MSTSVASQSSTGAVAAGTLHKQQQQQHHQRQVFNWLDDLNLTHLFDKFIENGYEDLELCMKIGESDLNAIGIQDLRERISLLQAVRQLQHELQQQVHHRSQQQHQNSGSHSIPFSSGGSIIGGVGSTSGKNSSSVVVPSSFLKALSPTRRKIPGDVLIASGSGSTSSRPSSRLGGSTWGHHNNQSEEVELQEIRRYHHFQQQQQTHSPSTAHAPSSPQSASATALSSFFHQQQQNTFNELIQNHQRRNNGGGNGLEHQQQQSLLLHGRRTLPLHQQHLAGRDFVSADDIHDGPVDRDDDDDDNGDYSECTDFDLILSAQRACSTNINHNNNIHHLQQLHLSREQGGVGGGLGIGGIPPFFGEQCSCDCGLYAEDGRPLCRNPHLHFNQRRSSGIEDDEPFYESVSPQPPHQHHQQTPHRQRHPSSSNNKKQQQYLQQPNHVNYPVPPLPLNYSSGAGKLLDQNNSGSGGSTSTTTTSTSGCVVEDNNSSSTGASSVISANSSSASNNGIHSQPNFIILRSQLRDQIIQDGINFSRVSESTPLASFLTQLI